jgi:HEAT repeat protein
MRKGRLLAFLLLLAALAGLIWLTFRGPSEPMYEGKPLSFWLEGYISNVRTETSQQQADHAMAAIGTNAIPTLLKMIRAEDSWKKRELMEWERVQSIFHFHFHADREEHFMAFYGFKALGPIGKSAVPELSKLLGDNRWDVRAYAAASLGEIGPASKPAIPQLLQLLNERFSPERYDAAISLGKIHAQPDIVVPALIMGLSGEGYEIRMESIRAISEFGSDAKSAIPNLVPFLNDTDSSRRSAATNAIKLIDPENAAKIFASAKSELK